MREVGTALVTVGVQSLDVVIRAELVREVLGVSRWVEVPGARLELSSVMVWSGRAVAVLDLARFHPGLIALGAADSRPRCLVVTAGSVTLALPADRVSEVWKTHDDNLKDRQLSKFELARSEVVQESQVFPLFDPELLLARLGVESAGHE